MSGILLNKVRSDDSSDSGANRRRSYLKYGKFDLLDEKGDLAIAADAVKMGFSMQQSGSDPA